MWVMTYLEVTQTVFRLLHNEKFGEKSYDLLLVYTQYTRMANRSANRIKNSFLDL